MNAALLQEQVLFVGTLDDELMSRWRVSKSLAQNHVSLWKDRSSALKYLMKDESPTPELVVLECSLSMPDVVDFLTSVRGNAKTHFVPIVVFFEDIEQLEMTECYCRGANSCVVKPDSTEEYSDTLSWTTYYWLNLNRPCVTLEQRRRGPSPYLPLKVTRRENDASGEPHVKLSDHNLRLL